MASFRTISFCPISFPNIPVAGNLYYLSQLRRLNTPWSNKGTVAILEHGEKLGFWELNLRRQKYTRQSLPPKELWKDERSRRDSSDRQGFVRSGSASSFCKPFNTCWNLEAISIFSFISLLSKLQVLKNMVNSSDQTKPAQVLLGLLTQVEYQPSQTLTGCQVTDRVLHLPTLFHDTGYADKVVLFRTTYFYRLC